VSSEETIFFASPAAFRAWLETHHTTASELWVGYWKKGTHQPSLTWPESVDEALCFGWIDGLRKSVDEQRYRIRFTPRKAGSIWSAVNVKRVAVLTSEGRMHPAGLRAFAARNEARTAVYAYEQRATATLGEAYEAQFRANAAAWAFFERQPPSYRNTAAWWVISAKQEATRQRRLATLIADSAAGRTIRALTRPATPGSAQGGQRGGE
jgi:uncharacterized protein YdeI (YjbR/CyaY-like superfamily)